MVCMTCCSVSSGTAGLDHRRIDANFAKGHYDMIMSMATYHPVLWLRWYNVSWHHSRSPKSRTKFLKICFTHIRSDFWKYVSPIFVNLIVVHRSWIHRKSIVNLSWIYREPVPDASSWRITFMKIMEFGLKWVHMTRYELILRLDGALWLRIILKPLLTPKGAIKKPKSQKS